MKKLLLTTLTAVLLLHIPLQSETNHFGEGGVFELDLDDSDIPLTPQEKRAQKKFLEEQFQNRKQ
tara:strand:+ start:217 stop:411 length:195 start_codon:yes stop_codon:yes gene_type:complete